MALENYRITEFQEKTQVDNGDYVLIDSATDGTHKYQLSRIPAQASAEVDAAVAAEKAQRQAADAELAGDIGTLSSGKVDKVAGKGLSTNDFTDALKTKLDGIEAGAEVNDVTSVAGKTGAVTLGGGDVSYSDETTYAEGTVGAAIGDVKSDLEQVRVAPRLASTDLNTVQTPGLYGLHSSQTYQNAPPVGTGAVGYLDVIVETSNGNPSAIFQCATYYKSDGDVVIYARRYSTWSQTWTDWDVADSYTDSTLTEEGVPADSKAVGDEIASVREEISEIDALSDEVKEALLACFEYVGWSSNNGDELRDNLYNALYGGGGMAIQTFTYLKNQVKALVGTINSVTVSDVIELRVKTDQTNRLVIGMTDGDHKLKNTSGSAVDLYLIPVPSGANFVKVTTTGGYEGNPVDFAVCSMSYNSTVNDYEKVLWSPQIASGTKIDITGNAGDGIVVAVRLNTETYPNPLDPNVISAKIEFFAS